MDGGGLGMTNLITPYEAEHKIEGLCNLGIELVGSTKYMQQVRTVEELNLQAHHNALNHSDEFVSDLLVTLDKIPTLIHELLVIEVWKMKVLPHLEETLTSSSMSVPVYLILQHELQVINLLECTLYHKQAVESTGGDAIVELVDYCYRKLVYLNTEAREYAESTNLDKDLSVKDVMNTTSEQELKKKMDETKFACSMCSLAVLRYLTDHLGGLDPGVMARLLDTHDVCMSLIPLLEDPPWWRVSNRTRQIESYEDNAWKALKGDERLRVNKHAAQIWLALNNLVVDPECRKKYTWTNYSIEQASHLKKYFNELLFDQLPVLKDLARVVDEIILGASYRTEEVMKSSLILEQIPEIFDSLVSRTRENFVSIAQRQAKDYFDPEDGEAIKSTKSQLESMLKSFEFLANLEDETKKQGKVGNDKDNAAGESDHVNVQIYKNLKEKGEEWEQVIDLSLKRNAKKDPEEVEQPAKELGITIKGLRCRLKVSKKSKTGTNLPLPSKGKITVSHKSNTATSTYEIPESGASKVFWISVGNLGVNQFALQLKSKLTESINDDGGVPTYVPEGGALTVRMEGQTNFVVPAGGQ
ncbi:zinc finger MYND domain-containing protein [Chloropicon primus]|uniref:Uncharacterized protein n=1 Tax=Chloropicon primus TaxID=1764295 RepID=A0A5B8MTN6_9CHLO|nr:hypothetical protein A3770_08p53000 [Chloropicon primus]UPR02006.1 zinc finger MYND domain-containing protein [Chloropicon primus]|eukprot:QDZ22782.1 hypothetical protein A3770_08p53000 [Chloropicon primus]